MHACTHACKHTQNTYTDTQSQMHTHNTPTHACTHARMHTHTHTHTHKCMCTYTCKFINTFVFASYLGEDAVSNMAVLEVKMVSGWLPEKQSLKMVSLIYPDGSVKSAEGGSTVSNSPSHLQLAAQFETEIFAYIMVQPGN